MVHAVDDRSDDEGAWAVRGAGACAGQVVVFSGPEARERARAYARWLNGEAVHHRSEAGVEREGANGCRR